MTKGYGVYYGCIYEGGGVCSPIYLDKCKAIKACEDKVMELQVRHGKMFKATDPEHYHEYSWIKNPEIDENYWENGNDCVSLQEFDIIE